MTSKFITCQRCKGNGEIVTDWERYMRGHEDEHGNEAVAECPDCGGEGVIDPHDAKAIIAGIAGITEEDLCNG